MKNKRDKPIHNYIGYEDLLQKLGYKTYKPKLGTLGRALLKASKNQKPDNFLKKYWDIYFKKLRHRRRFEKQNGRHTLRTDADHNGKKRG